MLRISQLWKLWKNYVRGRKLQDIPNFAPLNTEQYLLLRKMVKKTENKDKFISANYQQGIILPRWQKSLQDCTETGNAGFVISDRQRW